MMIGMHKMMTMTRMIRNSNGIYLFLSLLLLMMRRRREWHGDDGRCCCPEKGGVRRRGQHTAHQQHTEIHHDRTGLN